MHTDGGRFSTGGIEFTADSLWGHQREHYMGPHTWWWRSYIWGVWCFKFLATFLWCCLSWGPFTFCWCLRFASLTLAVSLAVAEFNDSLSADWELVIRLWVEPSHHHISMHPGFLAGQRFLLSFTTSLTDLQLCDVTVDVFFIQINKVILLSSDISEHASFCQSNRPEELL